MFDLIWLAAVWGRDPWLWLTCLGVGLLYMSAWRYLWVRRMQLATLIVVGLVAEYFMVAIGILKFTGTDYLPIWLVLLWFGFAAMALVVFTWLQKRYWLGVLAGLVFGPVTYFAGVRLDAAILQVSPFIAAVGYALMWWLIMLLVIRLLGSGPKHDSQ